MLTDAPPRSAIHRHAFWLAIAAMVFLIFLTRFGSLTREVIDHDESTFMLMGADVAAGHLPYIRMFDLKPPALFLMLGAIFALFGKSLLAVRLFGELCLFALVLPTFLVARRLAGFSAALGAALVTIAMASLDFGQPTYSELPATAFLMLALLLLLRAPVRWPAAAGGGLLVSLAVLTRTDLYPVAILGGVLLLVAGWRPALAVERRAWLAFGLAGLIPPLLLVLAYARAGELATLRLAMIDAPLVYAGQKGPLGVLLRHARLLAKVTLKGPIIMVPALLLALGGLALLGRRLTRMPRRLPDWPWIVVLTFALGTALALLFSGAAYKHYWLQALPFLGIFIAVALARAELRSKLLAAVLVAVPLGGALVARAPATIRLLVAPRSAGRHYDIAAAARHIHAESPAAPTVWCWSKQLVLWYLDVPPVSRAATHPDNLARPAVIRTLAAHGYVSSDEIGRIMASPPDYVVTDAAGHGLQWVAATGKPAAAWLSAHYRLDGQFGDVLVYRRSG
jgi:4-amino-4-deoxy-L-arabinose transferase-like glycosyltransferase